MGAIDTGLALLVAALLLILAWLVVLVTGRRAMRASFKGLGINVAISPCDSCPREPDQPQKGLPE